MTKVFKDVLGVAEFTHEDGEGACGDAVDRAEINSVVAVGFLVDVDAKVVFGEAALFPVSIWNWLRAFGGHLGHVFGNGVVAVGDEFAGVSPVGVTLLKDEELGGLPVGLDGFKEGVFGNAGVLVTQLPEGFGVTLAVEDGFDDVHRAEAIKVTEDMVDFEVHFGEGFLHVLKVAGGVFDELGAVAHDLTGRYDFRSRTKGGSEESCGVELLEPLGITDVGLLTWNAFDVACVDEADLNACSFQDVVSRDPVGAGGFHGDGGDAVFEKPVAEVMEVLGEGVEAAHRLVVEVYGDSGHEFFSADVDACGVRVDGLSKKMLCLAGLFSFWHWMSPLVKVVSGASGP